LNITHDNSQHTTWNTTAMAWIYLLLAGAFEVGFTTAFRFVDGWRLVPIAVFLAFAVASGVFLYKALEGIPLGTAYAVWTGIGAAGTVLLGIAFFKEPADTLRLFFLATLIASILGLKLVSPH
jgi:quaternary ammonium compound-resistance protein SugE